MGNFWGHATPGTFFLLFGLWWAFSCLRRYIVCRHTNKQYVSTPVFYRSVFPETSTSPHRADEPNGCRALLRRLPGEALVKMMFSAIGMGIEICAHLPPPLPGRIVQHTTMYFFFLLAGLVDVTSHLGVDIPDGAQLVAMALALVVEGLLFASHVHGREMLDVHIHMLLVKVIAVTVLVMLLEIRYRHSAILTLSRSFLLMLQGTWFWAVAVILYKHGVGHSEWDLNSPSSVMLSTIYFCWHVAALFIFLLLMCAALGWYYSRQFGEASYLCGHSLNKGLSGNGGSAAGGLHFLGELMGGIQRSPPQYSVLPAEDGWESEEEEGSLELMEAVSRS